MAPEGAMTHRGFEVRFYFYGDEHGANLFFKDFEITLSSDVLEFRLFFFKTSDIFL